MRTRQICLLLAFSILGTVEAQAEGCPTAKDDIATDRPDVTNSSLVVPTGSLQNENGVNFSMREDGRTFDGTNSRWRLVAPCLELLVDLPAPPGGRPGMLAGDYSGAAAGATVGAGPGTNTLARGPDRAVVLQPLAIQGQSGVNLALGISHMTLRPAAR